MSIFQQTMSDYDRAICGDITIITKSVIPTWQCIYILHICRSIYIYIYIYINIDR